MMSNLQDRGLFNRNAKAAVSKYILEIDSSVISPGTGTVSSPTPHTLENISKSLRVTVEGISAALSASIKSSITGNIKPLYPISLIPLLAKLLTAFVTAETAANVPNSPNFCTGNGGREEVVFCGRNRRFSKPAPTLSARERPGFMDASIPPYSNLRTSQAVLTMFCIGKRACFNTSERFLLPSDTDSAPKNPMKRRSAHSRPSDTMYPL
mmetsp:Transcript_28751/g.27543  ORF Transcript_28751/g.27543 Transcript_28751/m.27543 type:complete len:210 (-) Transcript_28751:624-1253(-)